MPASVATLTLDRPDKRNAQSVEFGDQIRAALRGTQTASAKVVPLVVRR